MYARGQGCQCAVRDSALRRREYQPDEIAEQQHLPWNDGRVPQHAAEDQPALDQRGGRVGQSLEVDLMSRWITLCNQAQPFAEAVAPGQQTIGIEFANLVVEQLILVGERSGKTTRMRLRKIGQHFGKELEADQKSLQRIFVELVAAAEDVLEHDVILREVAQQQALGELALVLEMVEEAAFRDAGRRDQLIDRGRGEAFCEHRVFSELEQAFTGVAALAWNIVEHRRLYHGCSLPLQAARIRRAPALSRSKTTQKITQGLDHQSAYACVACAVGVRARKPSQGHPRCRNTVISCRNCRAACFLQMAGSRPR